MRLILLLLAFTTPLFADAKRLELGFPGMAHRVQIVFPANYDASKKWPVVLYYHPAGATPDTQLIRHHTGEENWFTVGMGYAKPGMIDFTPQGIQNEMNILQSVRHHLSSKYNADSKRFYVAGFSKGGWMAGLFLQTDPSLAGAVILGGGHLHQIKTRPPKFARDTPVFLGIGRQDENYPYALNAVTFYRGLGATTNLETWHDIGHQFPKDGSPALTQWLAMEGDPEADHQTKATTWAASRLKEIEGLPLPVDRWVAFLDMQASPYYRLLDAARKKAVSDKRQALERTAVVAPEAAALAAHRKLLVSEMNDRSKENCQKLLTAYLELANNYPDARQGDIARHDHYRMRTLVKKFEEQNPQVKPEPEAPGDKDDPFAPKDDKDKKPHDRVRVPGRPFVR